MAVKGLEVMSGNIGDSESLIVRIEEDGNFEGIYKTTEHTVASDYLATESFVVETEWPLRGCFLKSEDFKKDSGEDYPGLKMWLSRKVVDGKSVPLPKPLQLIHASAFTDELKANEIFIDTRDMSRDDKDKLLKKLTQKKWYLRFASIHIIIFLEYGVQKKVLTTV
jgi:hypothetical protein